MHLDARDAGRQRGLGPGHRQQAGQELQRLARGEQDAGAPPAGRLARRLGALQRAGDVRQPERGAGGPPERQRMSRDLLQRDDVRIPAAERQRLAEYAVDAARYIPGDRADGGHSS